MYDPRTTVMISMDMGWVGYEHRKAMGLVVSSLVTYCYLTSITYDRCFE